MQSRTTGYPIDASFRGRPQPNQKVRIETLGGVALFNNLSKRNLTRIDQIATVRTAKEGDVLMREGEPGGMMLVVLDGRASVSRGKRRVAECTPGHIHGEMALLDNQPRRATVVALEPMRMVAIPGNEFRKLLTKVPSIAEAVLSTLSTRLREANPAADF